MPAHDRALLNGSKYVTSCMHFRATVEQQAAEYAEKLIRTIFINAVEMMWSIFLWHLIS